MTITLFNKLYDAYKAVFDLELSLYKSGMTHEQYHAYIQKEELRKA